MFLFGSPVFLPSFSSGPLWVNWQNRPRSPEVPHDARHPVARADGIDGHLRDVHQDLATKMEDLSMKYRGFVGL